jgi:hypothetical protein
MDELDEALERLRAALKARRERNTQRPDAQRPWWQSFFGGRQ